MRRRAQFAVRVGDADHAVDVDAAWSVGELKGYIHRKLGVRPASLVGLNIDDVPLHSLPLNQTQQLVVVEEGGHSHANGSFRVAPVTKRLLHHGAVAASAGSKGGGARLPPLHGTRGGSGSTQLTAATAAAHQQPSSSEPLCSNCVVLLRRVLFLTNEVFLHDRHQCDQAKARTHHELTRLHNAENSMHSDEVIQLRAQIAALEGDIESRLRGLKEERDHAVQMLDEYVKQSKYLAPGDGSIGTGGATAASAAAGSAAGKAVPVVLVKGRNAPRAGAVEAGLVSEQLQDEVDRLHAERRDLNRNLISLRQKTKDLEEAKQGYMQQEVTWRREFNVLRGRYDQATNHISKLEQQLKAHKIEIDSINTTDWHKQYQIVAAERDRLRAAADKWQRAAWQSKFIKANEVAKDMEEKATNAVERANNTEKKFDELNATIESLREEVRKFRRKDKQYSIGMSKLGILGKTVRELEPWEHLYREMQREHVILQRRLKACEEDALAHKQCPETQLRLRTTLQRAHMLERLRVQAQREAASHLDASSLHLGCEFVDGPRHGILLTKVRKSGPAYGGGLRKKDVVVQVGNDATKNKKAFVAACGRYQAGDKIAFRIMRNDRNEMHVITAGLSGVSPADVEVLRRKAMGAVSVGDVEHLLPPDLRRAEGDMGDSTALPGDGDDEAAPNMDKTVVTLPAAAEMTDKKKAPSKKNRRRKRTKKKRKATSGKARRTTKSQKPTSA